MNFDKRFGICHLTWQINNFNLAIRPDSSNVCSKEFKLQVHSTSFTTWKLELKIKKERNESGSLILYLERLGKVGEAVVHADSEVQLTAGRKKFPTFKANNLFNVNSKHSVAFAHVVFVQGQLLPFEKDMLTIEIYLIIWNDESTSKPYQDPAVFGMKSLTEDLSRLTENPICTDIVINVDGEKIDAHKAILSFNDEFKKCIERADHGIIELPKHLKYEAVLKFINFLYTRDIDAILSTPSSALFKCIEHFKCRLLRIFYVPEYVNLYTRIRVEKHDFYWIIRDFFERDSPISSPLIKKLNVNTTWQLIIDVPRDSSTDPNDDYISIFAKITEGERPPYFCLDFGFAGEQGESVKFSKRLVRFNNRYDSMGFKKFIKKEKLRDLQILIDGTARVVFSVVTSNGVQEQTIGARGMSFVTPFNTEPSYILLSSDMKQLLETKKYRDIILTDVKTKQDFAAHTFMLAARSGVFRKKVESMRPNKDYPLPNLPKTQELFKMVLKYIYSGVLEDTDETTLRKLYASAFEMEIQSLKEDSLRMLKEKYNYGFLDPKVVLEDIKVKLGDKETQISAAFKKIRFPNTF